MKRRLITTKSELKQMINESVIEFLNKGKFKNVVMSGLIGTSALIGGCSATPDNTQGIEQVQYIHKFKYDKNTQKFYNDSIPIIDMEHNGFYIDGVSTAEGKGAVFKKLKDDGFSCRRVNKHRYEFENKLDVVWKKTKNGKYYLKNEIIDKILKLCYGLPSNIVGLIPTEIKIAIVVDDFDEIKSFEINLFGTFIDFKETLLDYIFRSIPVQNPEVLVKHYRCRNYLF